LIFFLNKHIDEEKKKNLFLIMIKWKLHANIKTTQIQLFYLF